MRRSSALIVGLSCVAFSLIGSENKKESIKADAYPASASIVNALAVDYVSKDSTIRNDTTTAVISVLDFIVHPVIESVDSVSEAISVLNFISKLEKIEDVALIERNRQPVNRLYSGKLPNIDKKKFHRPVKGSICSAFGPNPNRKTVHYGVDLKGEKGDTVRAALPGVVKSCKNDPKGYGLYVCIVDSLGIETRYAHLLKILVKKGQRIAVAAPIGLVGSTGNSTGPHLHFEMRYKDRLLDPSLFLE